MTFFNNVKRGIGSLFGNTDKTVRTLKAITHNSKAVSNKALEGLLAGQGALIATGFGAPAVASSLPLTAAVAAMSLTLTGAEKVEDAIFPSVKLERVEEGDFVKQSDVGRLAEQYLRGEIDQELDMIDLSKITEATQNLAKLTGKAGEVEKYRKDVDKEAKEGLREEIIKN